LSVTAAVLQVDKEERRKMSLALQASPVPFGHKKASAETFKCAQVL